MPWKVTKTDNQIIDVLDYLVYVQTYIDGSLVRTQEPYASGVLSSDQDTAYHIESLQDFATPGFETVRITEISELDGVALRKALATGDPVYEGDVLPEITGDDPDPEDENPTQPDNPSGEILSRAELTAKVAELEDTNNMLMECIMEMSEIVYA